jgi:hypothetical protein
MMKNSIPDDLLRMSEILAPIKEPDTAPRSGSCWRPELNQDGRFIWQLVGVLEM